LKLWVKLLVSVGILGALFWFLPWAEVRDSFSRLPRRVWFGVLTGFLAGHIVGAAKWSMLLRALGAKLPWSAGVRFYAAGLFANLCLPGIVGGDVVRGAAVVKSGGRLEAVVLGGLADRIIDTSALFLLMLGGALAAGSGLPQGPVRISLYLLAAGLLGSAGVAGVLSFRPLVWWPVRLRRRIGRALVAMRQIRRRPAVIAAAFLMAFSIQGGFILLNAWMGRAIGIAVPVSVWFVTWSLAKLAGLMPVSFGGLGVRDATLGALLAGFGALPAAGVVASLLWQSVLIAGGLLAGLFWWGSSFTRIGGRSAKQ